MGKYYVFRQKTIGVAGGPAVLDGVPGDMDPLRWLQGGTIELPTGQNPLTLELSEESGTFRGSIIDGLLTLYHKKLREVLDDFGVKNIQYYPVLLHDKKTGKTEDTYFLVNITNVLDCVDKEKSKVKPWPSGRGFDFLSIVIDESKTQGLSIFRLKDDPTKVLIREDLKDFIDKNKVMVGVKLTASEVYKDF